MKSENVKTPSCWIVNPFWRSFFEISQSFDYWYIHKMGVSFLPKLAIDWYVTLCLKWKYFSLVGGFCDFKLSILSMAINISYWSDICWLTCQIIFVGHTSCIVFHIILFEGLLWTDFNFSYLCVFSIRLSFTGFIMLQSYLFMLHAWFY